MDPITLKPIAWLRSPYVDKFGTPRQGHLVPSSEASVEFLPESQAELWLEGLEGFSHIWLISVFHQNLSAGAPCKVQPPRLGGKKVGVLASRSPHRPNPIGLTLAEIVSVQNRNLVIRGVDLIDQTPILDIKPYVPESDLAIEPKGGWVSQNPWPELPIQWTDQAISELERIYSLAAPPIEKGRFRALVNETLRHDPRALPDRDKSTLASGDLRMFWLRIYDVDCGFGFVADQVIIRRFRFALRSALYSRFEEKTQQS